MTRERAKEILGEGATEEQITTFLNQYHQDMKSKDDEINKLNAKLSSQSDYAEVKKQLDEINKANMSEQEKLEEQKKEVAKNLHDSRIIVNTAKAKEILAGLNISDDLINSLVRDDEQVTITNATNLKNQFETMMSETAKKTKEDLATLDIKPNLSNVNQGDGVMTWEKFDALSQEEQNAFAEEHPEEFAKL